jgi:hypothetical protein
MRGFLRPAIVPKPTDAQRTFQSLSRHRRSKLAQAAHTTLVKADQWGRGAVTAADVATALEGALAAQLKKAKK